MCVCGCVCVESVNQSQRRKNSAEALLKLLQRRCSLHWTDLTEHLRLKHEVWETLEGQIKLSRGDNINKVTVQDRKNEDLLQQPRLNLAAGKMHTICTSQDGSNNKNQ